MTGIIVQLAISWLLVWLVERKNLGVLGFTPTRRRLGDFALFLLVTAICCASGFFMRIYFAKEQWQVNPSLNANLILSGLWWNIKSVLFEELIFRGVLLYILIKRIGPLKAILISSIAFGIYHWFSYGILGQTTQMIVIFFITGAMGLVFAYGYAKTFSLYIPCAIHLGWNFTHGFIFSSGSIGNGIFTKVNPGPFRTDSYILFFCVQLLPMVSALLANYLLLKRRKQVEFMA